jgi:hypothetical protein
MRSGIRTAEEDCCHQFILVTRALLVTRFCFDFNAVTSVTSRARTRWLPEQFPKQRDREKCGCA